MINTINKVIKRLFRLIKYRTKVYGKIGRNNTFVSPVYCHEDSIIGNQNYIGPYTMINNARISNYCSIAPGVKIGQGEHSKNFVTTYQKISKKIIDYNLNTKPTIIGNDVWIGANVVIKQDVNIDNGAIIGANAVVTKDIPAYAIAVGVPAKVIGYRFDEEEILKIQNLEWYNHEINDAIKLIDNYYKDNKENL